MHHRNQRKFLLEIFLLETPARGHLSLSFSSSCGPHSDPFTLLPFKYSIPPSTKGCPSAHSSSPTRTSPMVPELENARVTELHVRMDCNGCVQRIRRAIHGVDGIYRYNIDFAQQKLTVVGSVDPEKIVRAIRKTRKTATICSHTEPAPDPPATEPAPDPPAAEPPTEPPTEASPPSDPPPPETPAPEVTPTPEATATDELKEKAEVHMIHYYPQNHVYRDPWAQNYAPCRHGIRHEVPYMTHHSYSSYRPSNYVSEYGYTTSPPRDDRYLGSGSEAYYNSRGGREITSMFSDENPNACSIV